MHDSRVEGSIEVESEQPAATSSARSGQRDSADLRDAGASTASHMTARASVVLGTLALASALVSVVLARRCSKLDAEAGHWRRDLEAAVQSHEDELSDLAHQIRNPLGTIALNASLLDSEEVPLESRAHHLAAIQRAVARADRALRKISGRLH